MIDDRTIGVLTRPNQQVTLHLVILSSCHLVILSSFHPSSQLTIHTTRSPDAFLQSRERVTMHDKVTRPSGHLVILLSGYLVILSSGHLVIMNWLAQPFWNESERRLRAGWRILIHFGMWVLTYSLVQVATGGPLSALIYDRVPALTDLTDRIVAQAATLALFVALTWLVARYIDRRPLAGLGLQMDRAWWRDLVFGLVLGAVAMALVFLVEYGAGWVEIQAVFFVRAAPLPFVLAIFGPMVIFLVIGVTEELLFRGHQLRNLAEGLNFGAAGTRYAVLGGWFISSAFFGLFHVFNPYADWISTLNLAILGLMFGLGYILTGRLGLPIGLHITWNFFMGNVFGFPVSGNDFTTASVFMIRQQGPMLWTGGPFGPEAGLIGILAIALTSWAILAWVRRRYGALRLDLNLARYGARIGLAPVSDKAVADPDRPDPRRPDSVVG
jgi:uncharacterized protein